MFTAPDLFVPQQATLSELNAWLAANLVSAWARLYVNMHTFSSADTPSSYVEASFPGYVAVNPIPWGSVVVNSAGKAELDSDTVSWRLAATSGFYVIRGAYMTNLAKTVLYGVYPFVQPVTLSVYNKELAMILTVTAVGELGS